MGQTLTSASLTVRAKNEYKNDLDGLVTLTNGFDKSYADAFTDGTGSKKAQVIFCAKRSLLTTASETLDLSGSTLAGGAVALNNGYGVVSFTKIKGLVINVNTETSGYRLLIGGAASNAWETWTGAAGDIARVDAGGTFVISSPINGYTVTAGTGDILKIDNPSGGTVEYEIWIIGEGSIS